VSDIPISYSYRTIHRIKEYNFVISKMENSRGPTMNGIKKIRVNIRKNGRIIIKTKCNEIFYINLFMF
jgi:hypothetical protein